MQTIGMPLFIHKQKYVKHAQIVTHLVEEPVTNFLQEIAVKRLRAIVASTLSATVTLLLVQPH
jgi:hypothetical protein